MAPTKSKQWILDAIDHLRLRKARPDIHRICLMLKRKHGLPFPDTVACLEDLVHAGTVLKVDFKGNTSYRNASKWKQNTLGGHILNSTTISEKLKEAIIAVSKKNDNQDGADETDIKNWLCSADAANKWTSISVSEALQREITPGNIRRLPDGRYCLLSPSLEEKKKKLKLKAKKPSPSANHKNTQQTEPSSDLPGNAKRRGRPPSKRKKFKKLHHDDYISTDAIIADKHLKRESANQNDDEQMCDFCESKSNKNGETEQLLVCTDCTATAHPSCMGYSEVLARRAKLSPWQCIDCKTCFVCDGSENADALLFCDFCDKGCHMACHSPPIKEKPKGKWMCTNCQKDGVDEQGNDSAQECELMESLYTYDGADASFPPTPCDSDSDVHDQHTRDRDSSSEKPQQKKLRSPLVKKHLKNGKFPDASEWTINDVYNFFAEIGFQEQASAFIDQEIDGKSLLLMKRSDVLTGMSFKLGPALKIYQYIEGLQMAVCSS